MYSRWKQFWMLYREFRKSELQKYLRYDVIVPPYCFTAQIRNFRMASATDFTRLCLEIKQFAKQLPNDIFLLVYFLRNWMLLKCFLFFYDGKSSRKLYGLPSVYK